MQKTHEHHNVALAGSEVKSGLSASKGYVFTSPV